jgi:hypothetical protein
LLSQRSETKSEIRGDQVKLLKLAFAYINVPVYQCLMAERLFELGIGYVIVARKSSAGKIGAGFFSWMSSVWV